MQQTNSHKLLHAEELAPLMKPLKELDTSVAFDTVPSFQVMFDSQAEHYPYEKTFEEARSDPIVVLHSSGSTGETPAGHSNLIVNIVGLTVSRFAQAYHDHSWLGRSPRQ